MKKWTALLLTALLTISLTACGSETEGSSEEKSAPSASQTPETEEAVSELVETETPGSESAVSEAPMEENPDTNLLVAYFSYAENAELPDGVDASSTASIQVWNDEITGNTGVVAAMIVDATGADLFSIETVEKYPDTYDETVDQGQEERNVGARPELATHVENLDSYEVIFLGFPNWWGDMPMILYTFLEEYDFSGKTIAPFVTSGGSGFSGSIGTIESMEPEATVTEGLSLGSSQAAEPADAVTEWLAANGLSD